MVLVFPSCALHFQENPPNFHKALTNGFHPSENKPKFARLSHVIMHFIASFTIVGFAFNFASHKALIPIKPKTLGFAYHKKWFENRFIKF
jgi:hypothetical protein